MGILTLTAHWLAEEHGYLLPMRSGRFVEDTAGERFVLAPEGQQGAFCKLSVPWACAFGEGLL